MNYSIAVFGKSDIGLRRQNNEDAFIVSPEGGFAAVADGMGGAAAGEVASRIFIETTQEVLSAKRFSPDISPETLREVFTRANRSIIDLAGERPEYRGMGCTAELAVFAEGRFVIGHVGDSRTYLLRNGQLTQITKDHSFVQKQFDKGLISAAELRTHPMRNVILRAVGTEDELVVDTLTLPVISGDILLLCSDGLSDMVEDDLIQEVLLSQAEITEKAEKLIDMALSAGGRDNVTIVLFRIADAV